MKRRSWHGIEEDPVLYLAGLDMDRATGRVAFTLLGDEHRVHRGFLDQNARTGAMRDAYLYDYSLRCDE